MTLLEEATTRTCRVHPGSANELREARRLSGAILFLGLFSLITHAALVNPVFKTKSSGGKVTITGFSATGSGPLVIPATINSQPVVAIGDEAFYNQPSLTAVTIPSGVTSIGIYSFGSCTNLAGVTLPDTVTSIGQGAFLDTALSSASVPNSVTTLGDYAFYNCTSLTAVALGGSLTAIGNYVFDGCESLASVTLPAAATSVGDSAFQGCTSLTSVTFSGSVTTIGDEAFADCTVLASAALPGSVTAIGVSAFSDTALTTVTFPAGVVEINTGAFQGCASLVSAYFLGSAPVTMSEDAFASEGTGFKVYYYNTATGFTSPTWTYYAATTPVSKCAAANLGNPALSFSSATHATFTVGQNGSFTVRATGLPAPSFSATGLPAWASLDPATGLLSGVPPNTANAPFTITLTASDGVLPNATQAFTLNVQSTGTTTTLTFGQWEAGFFSAQQQANAIISGPTAMPQHDGLPNLLKYLYDINPAQPMTAADRAALPVLGVTAIGATNYFTLTYRQYAHETGITVSVQTSTDLQTWTTLTLSGSTPTAGKYTLQQVGTASTGDPIMEAELPITQANEFVRLYVTQP